LTACLPSESIPSTAGFPRISRRIGRSVKKSTNTTRGCAQNSMAPSARRLRSPDEGHPDLLEMLETVIEHRLMHAETLAYMLHRLAKERKVAAPAEVKWRTGQVKSGLVEIPEGRATIGLHTSDGDFARRCSAGTMSLMRTPWSFPSSPSIRTT
jgi:hypothetical protein